MIALFGLRDPDIAKIVEILNNHAEVDKGIIFGSRAKGNYKSGSDVDIALKGKDLDFSIISKISSLLNEGTNMPYTFDVLNYNTIKNSDLVEHIDRVGIEIYSKLHHL